MEVLDIEKIGHLVVLPLFEDEYTNQREFFSNITGIELPEKECIPWGEEQLWRAVLSPLQYIIYAFENGRYVKFEINIEPGFITDYASIPRIVRNRRPWYMLFSVRMPDNDSPKIIDGAIPHDALFAFKLFGKTRAGFERANELFRAICEYKGLTRRQCKLLKFGVDSRVGWNLYQEGRGHDKTLRASISEKTFSKWGE